METLLANGFMTAFEWIQRYIEYTPYLVIAFHLFILYVLIEVFRMIMLLAATKKVTRRNMRFSRSYPGGKKILVVGDSTAVGTGASSQDDTIAGRLGQDFPTADITNIATNGSLTREVLKQLKRVSDTKFDMIVISTGGNDVWNFSFLRRMGQDLSKSLQLAKKMCSGKVIVLFFGNEGSAPFFPSAIRKLLMHRTRLVRDVFIQTTSQEGLDLIQLFNTENVMENPFMADPKQFFAADGLHPNSAGYWQWYKRMWFLIMNKKYM